MNELKDRLEWINKNKRKWSPSMYECTMEKLRNDWIDRKMRKELKG